MMSIVFFVLIASIIITSLGLFSCLSEKPEETENLGKKNMEEEEMKIDIADEILPVETTPTRKEEMTVGERVQKVLKDQGIPFEIDEDGDVCFEYRFHRFVLNKSQSTNCFFLDMGFNENLDEQRRMMLLHAANYLHGMYSLIKMTVYESAFVLSVDSLTSSETDYKHLLRLSLDLLEDAYNELGKIISGQEKEQKKQVSTIGFYQALEQMQQEKGENKLEEQPSEETERPQSQPPSIGFNSTIYKSNKE